MPLSRELAEKLKELGYPQELRPGDWFYCDGEVRLYHTCWPAPPSWRVERVPDAAELLQFLHAHGHLESLHVNISGDLEVNFGWWEPPYFFSSYYGGPDLSTILAQAVIHILRQRGEPSDHIGGVDSTL